MRYRKVTGEAGVDTVEGLLHLRPLARRKRESPPPRYLRVGGDAFHVPSVSLDGHPGGYPPLRGPAHLVYHPGCGPPPPLPPALQSRAVSAPESPEHYAAWSAPPMKRARTASDAENALLLLSVTQKQIADESAAAAAAAPVAVAAPAVDV